MDSLQSDGGVSNLISFNLCPALTNLLTNFNKSFTKIRLRKCVPIFSTVYFIVHLQTNVLMFWPNIDEHVLKLHP